MPSVVAAGIALLVALAAWRTRALTGSGAIAATAVGTLVLWPLGWPGLAVLGAFFVPATLVGRLAARPGTGVPPDHPGDQPRTARQVLANGGAAAVLAPLELAEPGLGLWLASACLAAAAADTWATGTGALSPRPPRDILRWGVVDPGTSGGVTWFGTSGGLMGAALVALAAAAAAPAAPAGLYAAATATGFLGMLADSVLGSAAQARFHCPRCDRATELRVHRCGSRAAHRRGLAWLDNDAVNAVSTGLAAAAAFAAWQWRG
jgi:uncharacterized protein (TIGR00297 family)